MNGTKMTYSLAAVLLTAFTLSACGSGGSGGAATGTTEMLEGTAVKGPVNGATITAFGIRNGTTGESIGNATTDAEGHFSMNLGGYSGSVMLQLSGGTYTDEATGNLMTMADGDEMTAMIPALSPDETISEIAITPLTSMAQAMAHNMAGGMNPANISAANAWVSEAYMVGDILTTQPMNPLVFDSANSTSQNGRNYGMVLASMSQYAKDMGMTSSSAVVTAMMNDATDGVMDGMLGDSGVVMGGMGNSMLGGGEMTLPADAGTNGLANAMNTFTTSSRNRSGLMANDMQTLMNQLNTSSGRFSTDGTFMSGNGMVSGTAFNGTVQEATVTAYAVVNGSMGSRIASVTTDTDGNFSLPLGAYEGPVMLRMSGGTYTDLATAATRTMSPDTMMTALIPTLGDGNTTGIEITPLTSMAYKRVQSMAGGMTAGNINEANMAIGDYFMVDDIVTTPPIDPLQPGSGLDATQDSLNYGMTIAAMSQYADNIGIQNSDEIIIAMMNDAADGFMNGMMGDAGINMEDMGSGMMNGGFNPGMQATAGTSGLAEAMQDYMASATNVSGLTAEDMQALIDQLNASNGTLL